MIMKTSASRHRHFCKPFASQGRYQERSARYGAKGQMATAVLKLIGNHDRRESVPRMEGMQNLNFLPQPPGIVRSLRIRTARGPLG